MRARREGDHSSPLEARYPADRPECLRRRTIEDRMKLINLVPLTFVGLAVTVSCSQSSLQPPPSGSGASGGASGSGQMSSGGTGGTTGGTGGGTTTGGSGGTG